MALEPITRQEQIIAGKDLEPITRMEKFLKEYGGSGGGGTVVVTFSTEDGERFTADKTFAEIHELAINGTPIKGFVNMGGNLVAFLDLTMFSEYNAYFVALKKQPGFVPDMMVMIVTADGSISVDYAELQTV